MTAALAFQPSQPMAVTQVAGLIFQSGITPLMNPQIVDRMFLALFHGTDTQDDFKPQSSFWKTLGQDWLPTLVPAVGTDSAADPVEQQTADGHGAKEHIALVDKVFAWLADDMADFNEK